MTSTAPGTHDYLVREVNVPARSLSRFESLIGADRYAAFRRAAAGSSGRLAGRTVWNFNSTATGGGVAEMLEVLVGYIQDAGIDIRWHVIAGDTAFFAITKRIHNRLHGARGDTGALGTGEVEHYAEVTMANAASARSLVRRDDVVLLHDPQTAGMAASFADTGARVVWRCHVGRDGTNEWTEEAWSFLRPHLAACEAFIFSRRQYVPDWIDESKVRIIPPSIDPFSPKNQEMTDAAVILALRQIGLFEPDGSAPPVSFVRNDGSFGQIERRATIVQDGPAVQPGDPLVVQVSRWDRLKDMQGVMEGFAEHGILRNEAHLVLAGPAVAGVTDDPEGAEVLEECVAAWESLPIGARRRVRLVALPMVNVRENAVMVNALQRHASVIVQKSLAEGFGLTVAEGMWKAKAVVASAVGGIIDQIAPDTGILLEDPTDLDAYGRVLAWLLERPGTIADLGARARQRVLEDFVGDKHLIAYAKLIERLVIPGLAPAGVLGSADTAAPPD